MTMPDFLKTGLSKADILAIFRIFKMVAATILDFRNRKILLAIWVDRVETHQHAKFRQHRSVGCEGIKIFLFLPRNTMLSAVYAIVVCLSVCVCVCVCL